MLRRTEIHSFPQPPSEEIDRALALVPISVCVLSACHEQTRAGTLVRWAMRCAHDPALVCVAARKGHGVEHLIRDSHCFALSMVDRNDRLVLRIFDRDGPESGDPFDALEMRPLVTGSPSLARAAAALDCEVVRHFDLEDADHELYVGRVLAARVDLPG